MIRKGILLMILLLLALPGARKASGAALHHLHTGVSAPLADVTTDCLKPTLPPDYNFEVIPQASHVQAQDGNVLHTLLCNYIVKTKAPIAGGNQGLSGLAITIDFKCPPDTQSDWATKTSPRSNEVSRTPNSLLTRETGDVQGYAGSFTVEEKLFVLIDSHTIATIVVLTDPNPDKPGEMVFSANTAQPIAANLANIYAAQANDPACGPPPGGASGSTSSPPGGTSQAPGGYPAGSLGFEPFEWEHISVGVAAAVAVGVGAMAALFSGLLTGGAGVPSAVGAAQGPPWASSVPAEQLPPATSPVVPPAPAAPIPATSAVPAALAKPDPPPITQLAGPVIAAGAATAAVASSVAASESGTNKSQGSEDKEEDADKPCPEAQAGLFGLPDINTRRDCPGTRSSMGPQYAGIDFSSNDDHGHQMPLDFEACVSGEVTFVGGAFNMVQVTLENGNRLQFLHASQIYVRTGERVHSMTRLGKTGGTGPLGPNQYEIHLHIQALDKEGAPIDPDCLLAGQDNRRLHFKQPAQEQAVTSEAAAIEHQLPVDMPSAQNIQTAICARCGTPNPVGARFCVTCSAPLANPTAPVAPATPTIPSTSSLPPAIAQTVYCSNCGQALSASARFCSRCGTPQVRAT
jgi:ribosomal protein L40E